jgi:hypothetical protein
MSALVTRPASFRIRTNGQHRQLLSWSELTKKEQKEFDYVKPEDGDTMARFVRYKRWVYDTNDMMAVGRIAPLKGWDCYLNDSFFSGVLFKFVDEDHVIAGTFTS